MNLPEMLTKRLQLVIRRDTILVVHIAFAIAAVLDLFYIPNSGKYDKYFISVAFLAFIIIGLLRLKRGSVLERRPYGSILAYVVLGFQVQIFLVDIRSFWPFFWLVPIFLASFYYGKKAALYVYAACGLALALMFVVQDEYVTHYEDYLYNIAVFVIIGAYSFLFADIQAVSLEDRRLLVEAHDKAELEQLRLAKLMMNMTDAIVVTDTEGVINMHNPAAQALLNTHAQVEGQPLLKIVKFEPTYTTTPFWEIVKASKHPRMIEARLRYGQDDKADLEVAVVPFQTKSGSPEGYLLVIRDITNQKAAQNERNSFVSLLSHELRTPLATAEALLSNVDLQFAKQAKPAEIQEAVAKVRQELIYIMRITNNLELLVDSTPAAERSSMADVYLDDIFAQIQKELAPEAAKKKLQFSVNTEHDLPKVVHTHVAHLSKILSSLLHNAIKFTEQGSVRLTARPEGSNVRFDIIDTGEGIAKADQARIFNPFTQADKYDVRDQGGTGTGLYIAKKLATLLGGTISLTSEIHKGSTFTLLLPIRSKAPDKEKD